MVDLDGSLAGFGGEEVFATLSTPASDATGCRIAAATESRCFRTRCRSRARLSSSGSVTLFCGRLADAGLPG